MAVLAHIFRSIAMLYLGLTTVSSLAASQSLGSYIPLCDTLPPTPNLPNLTFSGTTRINNIDLCFSAWWQDQFQLMGLQIKHIAGRRHPVIAIDTRAHGRSNDDPEVPLYDLFANDTLALLDHLKVSRASIVGWSDGANTALSLTMHHGETVDRAFIFGANYQPDQANVTGILGLPFLADLKNRIKSEYESLSPNPDKFDEVMAKLATMQGAFPDWSDISFAQIKTLYQDPSHAPIIWIADGDSEEIVQRRVAGEMRDMIWGSSLVVMPRIGHFGPLQDSDTFNAILDRWLADLRR